MSTAAAFALGLLAAATARADTIIPVGTDLGSGVVVRLSTPLTALPRFGFLPLRLQVENTSERDGRWTLRFVTGMPASFPGDLTSEFDLSVPAGQNRGKWIFVPIAEPGAQYYPVTTSPGTISLGSSGGGAGSGIAMPTLPSNIPGLLPPPAGVTQTIEPSPLRTSPGGALSRTFVIKQTGPEHLLPEMTSAQLPPGAKQARIVLGAKNEATRTTILLVEATPFPTSGSLMSAGANSSTFRAKLEAAGLISRQPGVTTSTSTRQETNLRTGAPEIVTRISQNGPPASLPPADPTKVPAGVFSEYGPAPRPGDVTRTFSIREPATAASSPGGMTYYSAGSSSSSGGLRPSPTAVEAEARAKLLPTGLFNVSLAVKETKQYLPAPVFNRSGSSTQSLLSVMFVQRGPAADLGRPSGNLPPGTVVVLHPSTTPGEVVRTISYVDPAAHAASAAPTSGVPASIQMQMQGRFELQRYGYLRTDGGIQQTQSTRGALGAGVVLGGSGMTSSSAATTMVYSEIGPANLLPQPDPRDVPPGVTVTVTPGALPGETQRNFIFNSAPVAAGAPGVTAPASRGSSPVARTRSASPYSLSASLTVSGPGIEKPTTTSLANQLSGGSSATPPIAVSTGVNTTVGSKLMLAGVRSGLNLAYVEMNLLPADWRMWSSFHAVLMSAAEYNELDAARAAALQRWVALGGRLLLFPAAGGPPQTTWHGAGRIDWLGEPLEAMAPATLLAAIRFDEPPLSLPDQAALGFQPKSPLGAIVGGGDEPNTWLAIFLVVFAMIIGPVNLFFLAPATKRHRLFYTTPLLALLGAGGLAGAIILRDGYGGEGARRTLVVLLPGDHGAAVFQENAARTGFLSAQEFALAEDLLAVPLRGRSGTAVGQRFTPGTAGLSRLADRASGDWFRNRWRQALHVRGIVPTRMRVEVATTNGQPPIAESTLGTTLRDFVYVDAADKIWLARELPPGRRVALEPGDRWPVVTTGGTPCLDSVARSAVTRAPGRWTALGGTTEVAPLALMPGLRWSDDEIRYTGVAPVAGAVEKGGRR